MIQISLILILYKISYTFFVFQAAIDMLVTLHLIYSTIKYTYFKIQYILSKWEISY